MAIVLITDANQRKSIPIIRSLGRRGVPVLAADASLFSMGFYSKYCLASFICPSPEEHPEKFQDWLITEARRGTFDVLFPIDERTMDVVTPILDILSRYVEVPTVDSQTYLKARDKYKTISLAQSLGIPCPATSAVEHPDDLTRIALEWQFPVVIKPRISSGSRGLAYVSSPEALADTYQLIANSYPNPLVQEYIPPGGGAYGVEVLMNPQAEVRATFVHHRLREYPVSGGPSTLRESVAASELVDMGVRLLKAMGWFGVAMVEFKTDPRDGLPKLMEVNAKFWGSIALPIAAGVDFPYLLYRMAVYGDVAPVESYKLGIQCRWLLPGDLLHFISNPNRFKLKPSFFHFRDENLYYDLTSLDDIGPLWGMFLYSIYGIFHEHGFIKKYLSKGR